MVSFYESDNEFYKDILNGVLYPAVYINKDFIIEAYNDSFYHYFDIQPGSIDNVSINNVQTESVILNEIISIANILQTEPPASKSFTARDNGSEINIHFQPQYNNKGEYKGSLVIITKYAAGKLSISGSTGKQEKARQGFTNYGIAEIDNKGVILYVNATIASELNTPKELLEGRRIDSIYSKPKYEKRFNIIKDVLDNNYPIEFEEHRDGRDFHEIFIPDKERNTIKIITRELTQEKKAEKELLLSEARYKALFEWAADGILIGNAEGIIINCNNSITEISGYSKEEIIGSSINLLFDQHELKGKPFNYKDIHEGKTILMQRKLKKKDGQLVNIEMNTRKVADGRLQTYMRDISERIAAQERIKQQNDELVQAEEELKTTNNELIQLTEKLIKQKKEIELAKEKAEESDRLKSAFLANMSHEIRTPMNGIMGFAQMLKRGNYPQDKQRKFLGVVHSLTKHLLQIINDIVDISKIEADQLSIYKETFHVNDLMHEVYNNFAEEIENQKKENLSLVLENHLHRQEALINTDNIRLRQILTNLLSNAVKFTDEGTIKIGYTYSEGWFRFFVKDTGVGISKTKQNEIFNRFRQANDAMTRKFEGTGLGLSISKSLADKLGGQIGVESEKGKGSCFYFNIPQGEVTKTLTGSKAEYEFDYNWSSRTILLVEDEEANQLFLEELLEGTGAQILIAASGSEALDLWQKSKKIDLILLDIRLPDVLGLVIAKKIRETDSKVPIIAQTAYAMGNDREASLQAGCNNYISKPIDISLLLSMMNDYLG